MLGFLRIVYMCTDWMADCTSFWVTQTMQWFICLKYMAYRLYPLSEILLIVKKPVWSSGEIVHVMTHMWLKDCSNKRWGTWDLAIRKGRNHMLVSAQVPQSETVYSCCFLFFSFTCHFSESCWHLPLVLCFSN